MGTSGTLSEPRTPRWVARGLLRVVRLAMFWRLARLGLCACARIRDFACRSKSCRHFRQSERRDPASVLIALPRGVEGSSLRPRVAGLLGDPQHHRWFNTQVTV